MSPRSKDGGSISQGSVFLYHDDDDDDDDSLVRPSKPAVEMEDRTVINELDKPRRRRRGEIQIKGAGNREGEEEGICGVIDGGSKEEEAIDN